VVIDVLYIMVIVYYCVHLETTGLNKYQAGGPYTAVFRYQNQVFRMFCWLLSFHPCKLRTKNV